MIGRLRGILLEKQPPELLLDVNGVGYEIHAPMTTFYDLPVTGGEVILYTHLVVREDAHHLYGFISLDERSLFRALIRISGVGAKMALAILSGMSADEFARCVQDNNTAALVRLPGIGKKTAERLLIEMRDRIDGLVDVGLRAGLPGDGAAAGSARTEAVNALEALGYKNAEAERMVRAAADEGMETEEIIRRALRATVR